MKILFVIIAIFYPLMVFYGLKHFDITQVGITLVSLLILRFIFQKEKAAHHLITLVVIVGFITYSIFQQDVVGIKFYPVVVNVSLLIVFGYSLYKPPTVVERLARLTEPDLPEFAIRYTRKVTFLWCYFFVINGSIAAYTALYSSLSTWTLYNGVISYCLIGIIFVAEWLFRIYVKRKNES